MWDEVFKSGLSKFCGKQPLKTFIFQSTFEYFVPCYPHIVVLLTWQAGKHRLRCIYTLDVRCVPTDNWYKNPSFCLFKRCVNSLSVHLFLPMISFLVQTQNFCKSQIRKDQIWSLCSDEIVSPRCFHLFDQFY